MKKLILIVAFLFLFTSPALAAAPMSVEKAMKEQSLNLQDIKNIKSAFGDTSELDKSIREETDPERGKVSKANASAYEASLSSGTPLDYDYNDAIYMQFLSNPALISSYKKQGNLKSNIASDKFISVPVKKDGKIVFEMELEKSGNTYKDDGGEFIRNGNEDIYDKGKLIQLFHSAGIDTVNELHYVCTGTYLFSLVYVDTPNGEYAIPYECYPALKLTAGKVYKVSDIVNTLDENYNLENKKPQPGFGGVIAASKSAKPIAGKAVKPTSAKFNYVPYACVISGVVLVGIVLLVYFKHKKFKASHQ